MEYVFGTEGEIEVLKVKSAGGTDLSGYRQHVAETDVDTVTDSFRVVRKLRSKTDAAGNHYDWYEIDRHNRMIDKTPPVKAAVEANSAAIDDILVSMLEG